MMFYNLLTPGIFLMLASIPLSFVSKKFYKYATVILLLLSYSVLCVGANTWDFYWYEQFLFSDERILFILTSIFFSILLISIPIFFSDKKRIPQNMPLLFIYVGATTSILFTKNLLCIVFFLEIMMVSATLLIFSKKDELSKAEGLNYFRFHILGGTLLLIGVISYYLKYNTFEFSLFDKDNFYDFSAICILVGLLINFAVPPFSSWLLGGYMVVPSYIGLIFAVCTTKISALLMMQLFAGWNSLIFIGILTSIYGVIYSIIENNIRRMILYFIIAELGVILIFIGIGEKVMSTALIFIINDLLCIPTILCAANFIIHFFKKEKLSEIKKTFSGTKLVLFLISMSLFSIASLPFTLGYISKKYLHSTEYFSKAHWLPHVLDLLCGGIVFAICFKFIVFIFFRNFSSKQTVRSKMKKLDFKEHCAYIFALIVLYVGLFSLTVYFLTILGTDIIEFDSFFLGQLQHVLIVGVAFFLLRKHLIYNRDMYLYDPNVFYLNIGKRICERIIVITIYLGELVNLINLQSINAQLYASLSSKKYGCTRGIGCGIALAIVLLFFVLSLLK
jgi:multicomponent Na+:H+ antiporter subunit D